jgi:hypothetical protein
MQTGVPTNPTSAGHTVDSFVTVKMSVLAYTSKDLASNHGQYLSGDLTWVGNGHDGHEITSMAAEMEEGMPKSKVASGRGKEEQA